MPAISQLRSRPDDERAAFVRHIIDDVGQRIENREVTEPQARELAARARFQARLLIPGRMDTYDRIYGARFERLIRQFLRGES